MRMTIIGAVAVLLSLAARAADASDAADAWATTDTEGTWTASNADDGRVQLSLQWGSNVWTQNYRRAELLGLDEGALRASAATPVHFRIQRDAGVFDLQGSFDGGRGTGRFRFQPDRAFVSTLGSLPVEGASSVTERQVVSLAMARADIDAIRELTTLGLEQLDVGDLIAFSIHGVTADYVRSLRAVGVRDLNTVSQLVGMRIHGVSAGWVRQLRERGYSELTPRQLVAMRIRGVDSVRPRRSRTR